MSEQTEPIESGHDDASNGDKIAGILEQTKGDISQGNVSDVADALRQRLDDAGLEVGGAEFAALLAQLG